MVLLSGKRTFIFAGRASFAAYSLPVYLQNVAYGMMIIGATYVAISGYISWNRGGVKYDWNVYLTCTRGPIQPSHCKAAVSAENDD